MILWTLRLREISRHDGGGGDNEGQLSSMPRQAFEKHVLRRSRFGGAANNLAPETQQTASLSQAQEGQADETVTQG
jgi:hypothetical protein